jgi:hypothetical protein
MRRFHRNLAGAVLAAGVLAGTVAGTVLGAGAATLPVLGTTTSVAVTQSSHEDAPFVISATVDINGLQGALVTPSGEVSFTATNPEVADGSVFQLGSDPVAPCLLGLPSVLGIYSATCTASHTTDSAQTILLDNSYCTWTIHASYSGATDLVAQASKGQGVLGTCGP